MRSQAFSYFREKILNYGIQILRKAKRVEAGARNRPGKLATRIGVSKGIISMWEHGLRKPTLSNLVSLARFFGVSIDYLVGLSEY